MKAPKAWIPLLLIATGCTPLLEKADGRHAGKRAEFAERLFDREDIVEHDLPYGGVRRLDPSERDKADRAWLRDIRVTLEIREPTPIQEIVRMLKSKGINMTSVTPLEDRIYSGFGVRNVDGETALNLLLGSVGLDYKIDNENRYVTIVPVGSKTYYLNLGNRQTSYGGSAGASFGLGGSAQLGASGMAYGSGTGGVGQGGAAQSGPPAGQTNASTPGGSPSSGGTSPFGGSGGNQIQVRDQFWDSLKTEIERRLIVLVPNKRGIGAGFDLPVLPLRASTEADVDMPTLPSLPSPSPRQRFPSPVGLSNLPNSANPGFYAQEPFGNFSVNPETGAVAIRAPHWLLESFDDYFERIVEQYDTVVEFNGEIVHLTTDSERLEGLDVSAFASFAHGKYGAAVSDNALGGVTVSLPDASNALTAAAGNALTGAFPLVGMVSAANKLQVFNAYLSRIGHVDIVQKPLLVTSSGVPGEFRKIERRYYNNVQQQAAAGGTGSAAVGTQNVLVPVDTGIDLRIYPHYDVSKGLVRAQISLQQALQTGTQTQVQYLSAGGGAQTIQTEIPIVANQQYSGEAILRDGDLIVIGGQVEDTVDNSRSGISGLMDIDYAGGIFGRRDIKRRYSTYYFAVHMRIKKRSAA